MWTGWRASLKPFCLSPLFRTGEIQFTCTHGEVRACSYTHMFTYVVFFQCAFMCVRESKQKNWAGEAVRSNETFVSRAAERT